MGRGADDDGLIARARAAVDPCRLSPTVEAGGVGSALLTGGGAIHVGVCLDAPCGLGFCAEQAAIAGMITAGESRIVTIVAVDRDGRLLPPCGRCRELIWQVDPGNADARILLPGDGVKPLRELLPDPWLPSRVPAASLP